jgi:hypothetical protein
MDGDSEKRGNKKTRQISNSVDDGGPVLQSTGVRHSSVLVDTGNWKFVESELRFVLRCGVILWTIHLISTII